MAESTAIKPTRKANNGVRKMPLSRRDFLKLAGTGAAVTALAELGPFVVDTPASNYVPNSEMSGTTENIILTEQVQVVRQFEKLGAITDILLNDGHQDWADYLKSKFSIKTRDVSGFANSEEEKTLHPNDVATILKVCPIDHVPSSDQLENIISEPANELMPKLADYLSKNSDPAEWKKVIEDNKLELQVYRLGASGRALLEKLGYKLDTQDFQKKLIPEADQAKITTDPSVTIVSHENPKDTVVSIVIDHAKDSDDIFKFYPEIDVASAKKAEYILNRVSRALESCDDVRSDFLYDEFEMLMSWGYEHYVMGVEGNADTPELEFFTKKIFDEGGLPGNPLNKIPQRMQFLVNGLVENGVSDMEAKLWVSLATAGDMNAFQLIIDYSRPGVRAVFNSKNAKNGETSTLNEIFQHARIFNPNFGKSELLTATMDSAASLYLMRIEYRTISDGLVDTQEYEENKKSLINLSQQLLANQITLDDFVSEALGYRKIAVFTDQGEFAGQVVNGVAIEPVINPPEELIRILTSTEGSLWENGKDYLEKFIGKNMLALISSRIQTGGSDPAMQLMKMMSPTLYDTDLFQNDQIEKPENGSIFHRPDLYGILYLRKLYLAVRDEKATPFLYEECGKFDAEKLKDSDIGRICAKLETFLLARDFRNKFGDKKILDLYAQYVPLGNTSEGLQICGFEAASNYYFGKKLDTINQGEMAILVGMIQAPFSYLPNTQENTDRAKFVANQTLGKTLGVNSKTMAEYLREIYEIENNLFNRIPRGVDFVDRLREAVANGLSVSQHLESQLNIRKGVIVDQILKAQFTLSSQEGWVSDDPNKFTPGTFTKTPINLGFGLSVLREANLEQAESRFPDYYDKQIIAVDQEQPKLDAWLDNVVDKNQVELATHENSQVANTINSLWGVIYNAQSMRLSGAQIADRVATWCNKNSIDYQNDTYLKYRLLALASTSDANYWQCGQAALLINDVLRLKTGIPEPPFLAVPGAVKNWVATFDGKTVNTQFGYEFRRIDTELNDPFIDMDSIFQPGDMILSWDDADDGSPGHVCTVADKGVDSNGKQYLKLVDNNFGTDNRARSIVLWADDLTSYLTPARKSKTMIIRPEIGFNHGYQSVANDNFFGKQVLTATVENKQVTIPGLIQSVLNTEGDYEPVVNPGMAVAVFDADGFVAGVDRTHVLENTPVIPGGAIKPFVYAFLRLNGLNADDEIQFHPGNYALTDDKTLVTNSSLLIMNLDDRRKITVAEALAGGFDVPYQAIMKELIRENPDAWNQFQSFLNIFGVNLVDYKGEGIASPTALAATGRDVYVRNLDALGFGLSILMNPEKYFDPAEDGNLIDVLKESAEVLMSDKIRAGIDVRGGNTLDLVGEDPFKSNFANATTNVNVGLSRVLWSGTRLGEEDTGFVIVPDRVNNQNKVIVSRFRGGDLTRKKMINLLTLSRDAATLGPAGFPAVTLSVVNSL